MKIEAFFGRPKRHINTAKYTIYWGSYKRKQEDYFCKHQNKKEGLRPPFEIIWICDLFGVQYLCANVGVRSYYFSFIVKIMNI